MSYFNHPTLLSTAITLLLVEAKASSAYESMIQTSLKAESTEDTHEPANREKRYYYEQVEQPARQYNGYYEPYYYERPAQLQGGYPQYRRPDAQRYNSPHEREKTQKGSCNADSYNFMSLVSKVSDTKNQLESLTMKLSSVVEENFKRPIVMAELPNELMQEFNLALSTGKDLQNAAHYAYCAEPSLRHTLIEEVKSLVGSKSTLQSTAGSVPDSSPISGIKNLVNNVEGLVSEAIRGLAVIVSTQMTPQGPANPADTVPDSNHSDDSDATSSSVDPYAAFSDYGSTAAPGATGSISENMYASFSNYATISSLDNSPTGTQDSSVQDSPTNTPGVKCGPATFSTQATFKFTVTENAGRRNPITFTFTAWPTFTFSNPDVNKRDAGNLPFETEPAILDGIDQGDGEGTSDSGYTYNSDRTYSTSYSAPTAKHTTTSPSTSYLFTGTEGVFPHGSISFVQHETAHTSTFTSTRESYI